MILLTLGACFTFEIQIYCYCYFLQIRALRVLDPSGVLLEIVCEPVRKYLRTRDDTVRCIVQSLIDDNTNELADELIRNEGLCLDDSFMADDLNDPEELGKISCCGKTNIIII